MFHSETWQDLCPILALKVMIHKFPGTENSPLFVIPRTAGLVPLTDSVARKHLKDISRFLCLDKVLTFQDFRRVGAAWAFSNGVPLEHIMKHGIRCHLDLSVSFCYCLNPCSSCISTRPMSQNQLQFGCFVFSPLWSHSIVSDTIQYDTL